MSNLAVWLCFVDTAVRIFYFLFFILQQTCTLNGLSIVRGSSIAVQILGLKLRCMSIIAVKAANADKDNYFKH